MLKKILSVFISMIFILNITCMADDKIEEYNVGVDASVCPEIISSTVQTAANITEEPKINSRAAVVIDRKTKTVLYGKKETDKRAMASTTKIMTAMVVIQNTNLDNIVEITKKAARTGGSRLGLKTGDKISVRDLLYGLLLRSGNDSAVALAEYVGGNIEGFAKLMNQNAEALNLDNTHFVTPHGLDSEEHYTTAYELAILTDYALNNPVFAQIVNTKTYTITINGYSKTLNNTNELLGNLNGVYGVKTGFTNGAGRCLVTSTKRENMDIICVVLGADTKKDRTKDSIKLIEYIFNNYEEINLNDKIQEEFKSWNEINSNRINIEKGIENYLNLELEKSNTEITYPIEKNTEEEMKICIQANLELEAPVKENTCIGKLIIEYKGKAIKEINIINTNRINKKGIYNYFSEFISEYNSYFQEIVR